MIKYNKNLQNKIGIKFLNYKLYKRILSSLFAPSDDEVCLVKPFDGGISELIPF